MLLAKFDGIDIGQAWDEVKQGEVFTETLIEGSTQTMVVKAVGAKTPAQRAEQDAALDLVLSTMGLCD